MESVNLSAGFVYGGRGGGSVTSEIRSEVEVPFKLSGIKQVFLWF